MKKLVMALLLFFSVNQASAFFKFDTTELTDEALIAELDAIADELEQNNHDQKIMNMVYNRARLARKALNIFSSKLPRLSDTTDEDIIEVLQDINDSLVAINHPVILLRLVKKQLDISLMKLEENRQAPTEIAVLSISGADPLNFGLIFFGTDSVANLTITNDGNGVASFIGLTSQEYGMEEPYRFTEFFDGSTNFPGRLGTCGATLAAGASCEISIQFAPVGPGTFNDTLDILYFDGVNNQSLTKGLTGSAN